MTDVKVDLPPGISSEAGGKPAEKSGAKQPATTDTGNTREEKADHPGAGQREPSPPRSPEERDTASSASQAEEIQDKLDEMSSAEPGRTADTTRPPAEDEDQVAGMDTKSGPKPAKPGEGTNPEKPNGEKEEYTLVTKKGRSYTVRLANPFDVREWSAALAAQGETKLAKQMLLSTITPDPEYLQRKAAASQPQEGIKPGQELKPFFLTTTDNRVIPLLLSQNHTIDDIKDALLRAGEKDLAQKAAYYVPSKDTNPLLGFMNNLFRGLNNPSPSTNAPPTKV